MWTIALSLFLLGSWLLIRALVNVLKRRWLASDQLSSDSDAFETFMLEYQRKQNIRQVEWRQP